MVVGRNSSLEPFSNEIKSLTTLTLFPVRVRYDSRFMTILFICYTGTMTGVPANVICLSVIENLFQIKQVQLLGSRVL